MNSKTSQQLFTFKRFTYILPSRSNQRQENWGSRSFRRRPPTRHWIVKGWGGDTRRWWEPLDSQGEGWRNTWLRRHSPPARRHLPPPRERPSFPRPHTPASIRKSRQASGLLQEASRASTREGTMAPTASPTAGPSSFSTGLRTHWPGFCLPGLTRREPQYLVRVSPGSRFVRFGTCIPMTCASLRTWFLN